MSKGRMLLIIAGWAMVGLVVLHLAAVVIGEEAYDALGAGEDMVRMAREGSWVPSLLTLLVAALLAVWALYAFSGAGVMRPLPGVTPVLYVIAGVLLVRAGAGLIADLAGFGRPETIARDVFYSVCALLLGLLFLLGARQRRGQ